MYERIGRGLAFEPIGYAGKAAGCYGWRTGALWRKPILAELINDHGNYGLGRRKRIVRLASGCRSSFETDKRYDNQLKSFY
jgi:hypothetical protein